MDDWRSDAAEAVGALLHLQGTQRANRRWVRVGEARPAGHTGWLTVDLRDSTWGPDDIDQLCLVGQRGPAYPVDEYYFADGVLVLRSPAAVPSGCRVLWAAGLPARLRTERLMAGLRLARRAPLADALAAGRLAATPALPTVLASPNLPVSPPAVDVPGPRSSPDADAPASAGAPAWHSPDAPGSASSLDLLVSPVQDEPADLLPAQLAAYRACVSAGVRLVWAPPGTGATRVLARAIERLVRANRRVLLVSSCNAALDDALRSVVEAIRPEPGVAVRVGPAHLAEIAGDSAVRLDLLTAAAADEVDRQRSEVEAELTEMDRVEQRIAELSATLDGYDDEAYRQASDRLDSNSRLAELERELQAAEELHERRVAELATARVAAEADDAELRRTARQRTLLAQAADLTERVRELDRAVAALETKLHTLTEQAAELHEGPRRGPLGWLRLVREMRAAGRSWDEQSTRIEYLWQRRAAYEATIVRRRECALPVTDRDVIELDLRRVWNRAAVDRAAEAERDASDQVRQARQAIAALEAAGPPSTRDRALVAACRQAELPRKHEELRRLTALHRRHRHGRRRELEAEHRRLVARARGARREAEAEVIRNARLVVTTLARSRMHPAIAHGTFDAVLVDHAEAAPLAELLLALCRAKTTAVLFGDFVQPGPALSRKIRHGRHRWLLTDCFAHVGIRTPLEAQRRQGCVVLTHQFRLGPALRELATGAGYQLLRDAGARVTNRTEVVLVDVSGLPDLAVVRTDHARPGWWPVGAMLSRALAEQHFADGAAIVTAYPAQRDSTLAALRDRDAVRGLTVGTVRAFRGRQFQTVVFDLGLDAHGWPDDGPQLFAAGITTARQRLYLIGDASAIRVAGHGPLAALSRLCDRGDVDVWPAAALFAVDDAVAGAVDGGRFAAASSALRRQVGVIDISDGPALRAELTRQFALARRQLWLWSPWLPDRVDFVLPPIAAARRRGVDVRILVHPDELEPASPPWTALRDAGAILTRVDHEHRKIAIVDDRTVLLGTTDTRVPGGRELLITMAGRGFATRLLADLRAEEFGTPRHCTGCGSQQNIQRERSRPARWFLECRSCRASHYLDHEHPSAAHTLHTVHIGR